jgi:hypothetical protein
MRTLPYLPLGLAPRAAASAWDAPVTTGQTLVAVTGQTHLASGHRTAHGVVHPVPWDNIDNAAPAGAITSNARDMARVTGTRPTRSLDQYAGTWNDDPFSATWQRGVIDKSLLTFELNSTGKVDDLRIDLGGDTVTFRRPAK